MSAIKIKVEKPIQEFEIEGKSYYLDYADDALKRYKKNIEEFMENVRELEEMDTSKMTEEEQEAEEKRQLTQIEGLIDTFFGKGSYKVIYQDTGRSMYNIRVVIEAICDFITKKLETQKAEKKKKYIRE